MKSLPFPKLTSIALLGAAVGLPALLACGCGHADDDAPTNTKNSQYMGGGNTVADQVGAERKKARLPHGTP